MWTLRGDRRTWWGKEGESLMQSVDSEGETGKHITDTKLKQLNFTLGTV